MGLSSVAAIAFSAMQAQSNNLSATADNIANAETSDYVPQGDIHTSSESVDIGAELVDMTEEELSYRANAAAFETGADLWDILNVVTRD
jgi:flagellar hook protein FlgE